MNIRGDVKEITRHLDKSQRWVIPQAVPAALNKTSSQIGTQTRREIAKQLAIPQKHFSKRVKLFRAARRNWASKNWIGLKTKIPVANVFKSQKKQLTYAKGLHYVPANKVFGATMPKTQHQGVFYRKGDKRLPIQEVQIDLSKVAEPILHRLGQQITIRKFKSLLAHELQWRLNRKG